MMRGVFVFIVVAVAGLLACAQPRVIAHQGAWQAADSAQNSIAGLQKAAELKCYGSEFDVHLTVDNVPVVYHDNLIGGVRIQDTTYGNIQYGRLRNGEYLPTLIQFLQAAKRVPEIQLILEIKPHRTPERDRQAAATVAKLVSDMGLTDRVEYISFSMDICKELHRQSPEAKVSFLEGMNDVTPQQLKDAGLTGIDYHYSHYDRHPEWIPQAKKLGLEVNVWTVDGEELLRKWIATPGIDVITTNNPELLNRLLGK